jgi:hypothetical protein
MSTFIQRLRESKDFDGNLAEALQTALKGTKLPKADDLVGLISEASGEALA